MAHCRRLRSRTGASLQRCSGKGERRRNELPAGQCIRLSGRILHPRPLEVKEIADGRNAQRQPPASRSAFRIPLEVAFQFASVNLRPTSTITAHAPPVRRAWLSSTSEIHFRRESSARASIGAGTPRMRVDGDVTGSAAGEPPSRASVGWLTCLRRAFSRILPARFRPSARAARDGPQARARLL